MADAIEAAYREGAALGASYGQHTTAEIVTAGWFTSKARARPAPAAEGEVAQRSISVQDPLLLVESLIQFGRSHDGAVERDLRGGIRQLVAERDEARAQAHEAIERMCNARTAEINAKTDNIALTAQLARPAQGSEEERMAAELAPTLDLLLDAFLSSPGGDIPSKVRGAALKTFLWDNKVSILRILQAHAIPRPQEGWQDAVKTCIAIMLRHRGDQAAGKCCDHCNCLAFHKALSELEKLAAPTPAITGRRGVGETK